MPEFKQKGFAQLFIILLLFAGLIALLFLIRKPQTLRPKAAANLPNSSKNILLNQAEAPLDNLGDRIVFKSDIEGINQNPRYLLDYQPSVDLFMLVINDAPIEQVREEAEKYLLQRSGNNLQSLCRLKFSIIANKNVTDDGYSASDNTLGVCKELKTQLRNPPTDNFNPTFGDTIQSIGSAISHGGNRSFLSDKPIVASENLPNGVYITLCRNDGTNAEGVWQISNNPQAADHPLGADGNIYTNQENGRCNWPVPNYLVFTQDVPVGAYLSLCDADDESQTPRESFWQVDETGRIAKFGKIQPGCSETPPLPQPKPVTTSRIKSYSYPVSGKQCSPVHEGLCSVENLTESFGGNAEKASIICYAESTGNRLAFSGADAGLFQINLSKHGETKEHWFDAKNNIAKAVDMSGGVNWHPWSTAYEYACTAGVRPPRIPECGFYSGLVPWHTGC